MYCIYNVSNRIQLSPEGGVDSGAIYRDAKPRGKSLLTDPEEDSCLVSTKSVV